MTVSIRASLVLSAIAMAALTAGFANPSDGDDGEATYRNAGHWSYDGENGPAYWGALAPENAPCANGIQQSPVDLAGALTANIATPRPAWTPVRGAMVVHNGHTIQVDLSRAGGVELDGVRYSLKQLHFHQPSEHTIGGKAFPLELHLMHATEDGRLAVIGVLFEEGDADPALDNIWATAPGRQGKAAVAFEIDVAKLVPANASAYRYEGSLTTPPCSETVSWTVMAEPRTASASQIAAFAALFSPNARPVQPLNRRYVLKTSG